MGSPYNRDIRPAVHHCYVQIPLVRALYEKINCDFGSSVVNWSQSNIWFGYHSDATVYDGMSWPEIEQSLQHPNDAELFVFVVKMSAAHSGLNFTVPLCDPSRIRRMQINVATPTKEEEYPIIGEISLIELLVMAQLSPVIGCDICQRDTVFCERCTRHNAADSQLCERCAVYLLHTRMQIWWNDDHGHWSKCCMGCIGNAATFVHAKLHFEIVRPPTSYGSEVIPAEAKPMVSDVDVFVNALKRARFTEAKVKKAFKMANNDTRMAIEILFFDRDDDDSLEKRLLLLGVKI